MWGLLELVLETHQLGLPAALQQRSFNHGLPETSVFRDLDFLDFLDLFRFFLP